MGSLWNLGALSALVVLLSVLSTSVVRNGSSGQAAETFETSLVQTECLPGPFKLEGYPSCASAAGTSHASSSPWTHPPYCIEDTEYCVFTKANFQGSNRGVSVIDVRSTNLTSTALTIASTSDLPASETAATETDSPPYEVRDIPGKGKGLVATRKIPRGQSFMVDYASIVADTQFPSRVKRDHGRRLLTEAIQRLPSADLILNLARSSPDPDKVPAAEDVMKTNSFSVDIGGKGYMALFPNIARINHACKPSTLTRFNATTLSNTVTAFHDILPGEEITISYSPFGLTSQARQQTLLQKWGFRCTCALCASPPASLAASDARRRQIAELGRLVLEMVDRGDDPGLAAQMYERVVEAVKEEGLVPHLGAHYEVLGRLYIAAGQKRKGVEMVRRGVEEERAFGGGV